MSKRSKVPSVGSIGSMSNSSSVRSPKERTDALRYLLKQAESISKANISPKNVLQLKQIVNEADIIHNETSIEEKAVHINEVIIDAQLMYTSTQILDTATANITKAVSNYNCTEFAEKILRLVHISRNTVLNEPDFLCLQKDILPQFTCTAHYMTLSGCLDSVEKKVVVKRQYGVRGTREPQVPTRKPEAVVTIDDDDHNIGETVQKIAHIINKIYKQSNMPIDYFRLILHPKDFGKTVENMLHVSFLVRDGFIKMYTDDNRNLVIMPCTKEMRNEFKRNKENNTQNVFALNTDQWKALVQAYRIQEPIINFQ